jgi:thymidylate synthase ThyX
MSYKCEILADSISDHGDRLTTFLVEYPRIVLSETNTHRMLSKNTASSRAIPVAKQIAKVRDDPFIPTVFGKNQKGMVAEVDLTLDDSDNAELIWNDALYEAVHYAQSLDYVGVHKQLANRIIEPYTWITQIITGTDWSNFFKLRCAPDAQPEMQTIAMMMQEAYTTHTPQDLPENGWHLPLVTHLDQKPFEARYKEIEYLKQLSIGRCARVSYLTHDGKRNPEADIALYERLWASGHLSPFEHVARPFGDDEWETITAIRNETTNTHIYGAFIKQALNGMEYVGNLHGWISERMALECHI